MDNKIKIIEGMDSYLPDVDGVVNCVHNYCLNMNDKAEINVVVPQNRKDYVDAFPYKIHRCKSIHIPVINVYYGRPQKDKNLKRKIDSIDADIVHIHSPFNMAKFGLQIAKKKNIPAVATFHSNMRPIFRDVFKFKFIAEMLVKNLGKRYNKFDEVFVCSPMVEEQLRSFGYTGKVTLLPFGTELPKCENVEELIDEANKKLNLDSDEIVFLYVGRIMKLKRIDFILRSLKIIKDQGKKFKFFIVGKGAEMKKLKKLSKKLGFSDEEIIFTGFIERELFPLINARANLLLFPSLYDNFGLVKVEAAAYSTPGLFIENSCAGYGVTDGVNGYLSKDNENSFAEKINEAISDMNKLKEVGINAGNDIYIHWSECSQILLNKLTEIVEERKNKQLKNEESN